MRFYGMIVSRSFERQRRPSPARLQEWLHRTFCSPVPPADMAASRPESRPHVGDKERVAMIELHYWTTPNGHQITMFLEEAGVEYKIVPVHIGKGEQFKPEFLTVSPNNRIPALVDHKPKDGGAPISVFESGAMLLYLAEKTGNFLPTDTRKRYDAI